MILTNEYISFLFLETAVVCFGVYCRNVHCGRNGPRNLPWHPLPLAVRSLAGVPNGMVQHAPGTSSPALVTLPPEPDAGLSQLPANRTRTLRLALGSDVPAVRCRRIGAFGLHRVRTDLSGVACAVAACGHSRFFGKYSGDHAGRYRNVHCQPFLSESTCFTPALPARTLGLHRLHSVPWSHHIRMEALSARSLDRGFSAGVTDNRGQRPHHRQSVVSTGALHDARRSSELTPLPFSDWTPPRACHAGGFCRG